MTLTTTTKYLPGHWLDLSSTGHAASWYAAVKQAGYAGVVLDLQTPHWAADYYYALSAGLGVLLNQGYYAPAWKTPSEAKARGQYALAQIKSVSYAATAPVFLDCEQMNITEAEAVTWINAWNAALKQGGHTALGVYVGAGCPLTAQSWYSALADTTHYWKSASTVPAVATRGYQIIQTSTGGRFQGVPVDFDTVGADQLHQEPLAVVANVPKTTTTTDWKPYIDALKSQVATLQSDHTAMTKQLQTVTSQQTKAGAALQGH